MVQIALVNGKGIKLEGVTLVPDCESNLILLGQLQDNEITYYNNASLILLMQDGLPIAYARRDRNLFILDLATPGKVMQVNTNIQAIITTGRGRPIHLISRIKKVRIWHQRFGYASNAKIIRALKLLDGIGNLGGEYDLADIYSNSEAFNVQECFNSPNDSDPQNPKPEDTSSNNLQTESTDKLRISKITNSDLDKICEPCVESKQTQVVRRQKLITPTEEKLEEVQVDL